MILIVGATGMFGSRARREVAARGVPVRALVRSAARAGEVQLRGVEIAVGDLDDPMTLGPAFAGVETAFLVSPMDDRIQVREANALRAALEAGVRRVVKLCGAVRHRGDSLVALHLASVAAIRASGLSWSLVSPDSVMEGSLVSQAQAVSMQTPSLAALATAGSGSSPPTTQPGLPRWSWASATSRAPTTS